MSLPPQKILLTGANGHLGQQWLKATSPNQPTIRTRALVRSDRAAEQIRALGPNVQPEDLQIVDYADREQLAAAAQGCDAAIHLVGILKPSPTTSYQDAHETTCQALAAASREAGLRQLVYPSIFGAGANSANACLASKGRAEQILIESETPTTVLRLPMVLGPGDFATRALAGQARARFVPLVGGGATLQQPIDVRDVVGAMFRALQTSPPLNEILELGGPETLSHAELIARAAAIVGGAPRTVSLPLGAVRAVSSLLETLLAHPPLSRTVLEVLQHDDCIDNARACSALELELRDLDSTLRYCLLGGPV